MTFTKEQQPLHELILRQIAELACKEQKPLVLKGGTALRLCYGLDRFSEDLDFDTNVLLRLENFLASSMKQVGISHPLARNATIDVLKSTNTSSRYRINYAGDRSIKVEVSHRTTPKKQDISLINGILTYKVDVLIDQKLGALQGRTAARDLHDVVFLFSNYRDFFSEEAKNTIMDLYENQDAVLDRFGPAYSEDTILTVRDLLDDLSCLIDDVESQNMPIASHGPTL